MNQLVTSISWNVTQKKLLKSQPWCGKKKRPLYTDCRPHHDITKIFRPKWKKRLMSFSFQIWIHLAIRSDSCANKSHPVFGWGEPIQTWNFHHQPTCGVFGFPSFWTTTSTFWGRNSINKNPCAPNSTGIPAKSKQSRAGVQDSALAREKQREIRSWPGWSYHPQWKNHVPSLKLTFSPLKMDGWNTTFLLGRPFFRGYVSFREGKYGEIEAIPN